MSWRDLFELGTFIVNRAFPWSTIEIGKNLLPLISSSTFRSSPFLPGGHLQTMFPTLFRGAPGVRYVRERIETPDDDFLDLDWVRGGARRLAILSHGLEGSSRRWYMAGMATALNDAGWDALAWNYRGCSGEPNRTLRFYHSGATDDLDVVVRHAITSGDYDSIVLIGFSLGGNLTLKYLGERGGTIHPAISVAIAYSVPCDLASSAARLAHPVNRIYMRRFMKTLRGKIRTKMELMPGMPDVSGLEGIETFQEFDDRFTAPLHGFRDATDYWYQSSSRRYLEGITVPALLVNARNDPFLTPECYPVAQARSLPYLFLEIPSSGGHVGFIAAGARRRYWMEHRAIAFLRQMAP